MVNHASDAGEGQEPWKRGLTTGIYLRKDGKDLRSSQRRQTLVTSGRRGEAPSPPPWRQQEREKQERERRVPIPIGARPREDGKAPSSTTPPGASPLGSRREAISSSKPLGIEREEGTGAFSGPSSAR
jgi:hypothetical protein